jgi:hypothetical protein
MRNTKFRVSVGSLPFPVHQFQPGLHSSYAHANRKMAAPSFADENPIVQDFYTGLSPDERLAFAAYYVSVRNRHIKEGRSSLRFICMDSNQT